MSCPFTSVGEAIKYMEGIVGPHDKSLTKSGWAIKMTLSEIARLQVEVEQLKQAIRLAKDALGVA